MCIAHTEPSCLGIDQDGGFFVGDARLCSKCKTLKPLQSFHKDRRAKGERKPACRSCTNKIKARWRAENKSRVNAQKSEHYARNRDSYLEYQRSDERRFRVWEWKLKTQFGITVEDWKEAFDRQNGRCAICGLEPHEVHSSKKRLCVDHDHTTGAFRGLLCGNCNAAIGYMADSIDRLVGAIEYLQQHETRRNATT